MTEKKTTPKKSAAGFSAEEKAAMKERASEMRVSKKVDGEAAVMEKINAMPEPERSMALRLHQLIKESGPSLRAKTWYGMPAYTKDDKVICFFQAASKFGTRYATLGFSDAAALDDGNMWPASFALMDLTPAEEERIRALVKKAAG